MLYIYPVDPNLFESGDKFGSREVCVVHTLQRD
jgi:hypothetical protein